MMDSKVVNDKRKYSVLFLSHERKMGGANCSLYELAVSLKNQGHDVHVAVLFHGCPIDKKLKAAGIPTVSAFYGWWQRPDKWPFFLVWAFKLLHAFQIFPKMKLMKYIKNNHIEILHTNSSTLDIGCQIKQKMGIKHIYHFREFGKEDFDLIYMYGRERSLQYLYENIDKAVFISEAIRKSYLDFDKNNLKSLNIYNAVSVANNVSHLPGDKMSFIQTGTINPGKNQMVTLEAVKILKDRGITDFVVKFAGEATSRNVSKEYKQKLLKFKEDNKLNNVEFLGRVEDMPALRKNMDAEIVPSKKEAFGRVTVEAMMSGMPVIASDSGANVELISDGENGFIFNLDDATSLADKMKIMIDDRGKCKSMGEKAKEYAILNFSLERLIDDIESVYEGVLK